MLQNGVCVCVLAFAVTAVAWCEEAPGKKGVKKQRVSPKVLREAMALREYNAQAPAAAPVATTSIEQLQRLTEKLKSADDHENAQLLERFIHEHQQLVKQSTLVPTSNRDEVDIQCELIEVKIDEVEKDSILFDETSSSKGTEIRKELERLVLAKKARVLVGPASFLTKFNETCRIQDGEDLPVPTSDGSLRREVAFQHSGTTFEVLPTLDANGGIVLTMSCEIRSKDMEHTTTVDGTIVPGITKSKVRSTMNVHPGESNFHSFRSQVNGKRIYLMSKVTPKTGMVQTK